MNCPHCGNWQPEDAQVCGVCAEALDSEPEKSDATDREGTEETSHEDANPGTEGGTASLKMDGLWESDTTGESADGGGRIAWTVRDEEPTDEPDLEGAPDAETYVEQQGDVGDRDSTENIGMTEVYDLRARQEIDREDVEETEWTDVRVEQLDGPDDGLEEVSAPYMVVAAPSGPSGESATSRRLAVELSEDELVVGRACGPELFRKDPFLSNRHARIVRDGDGFVIEDLDSLNRVYREVQTDIQLEDEQWIRLGKHVFVFTYLGGVQVQTRSRTIFAATPNPGYWAKLQTVLGPETFGPVMALEADETTIGRTRGMLTLPDDPYVSAAHAVIRRTERGAILKDLDSVNGSYVSISKQSLADGERFLLGQHILEFHLD